MQLMPKKRIASQLRKFESTAITSIRFVISVIIDIAVRNVIVLRSAKLAGEIVDLRIEYKRLRLRYQFLGVAHRIILSDSIGHRHQKVDSRPPV